MSATSEATSRVRHDYRTVSVYPQHEDILSEAEVHLSKNVTLGKYRHVWHYLATHFNLLREDFMAPLRRALSAYKEALKKGEAAEVSEFRVYQNARFVKWESYFKDNFTLDEIERMDVKIENRVNRKMFKLLAPGKCQQKIPKDKEVLIYGTLLCFSNDNFETVFFGLATRVRHVNKGFINVELLQSKPLLYTKSYTMLECTNYFHVYKVVLLALQNLKPFHLPMQSYIVDTESKIAAPAYTHSLKFTLANVTFKVADLAMWPSKEQLSLNTSQYEAFRNALTSEFAIIQGPPGTGKTYVTVKIAETFIKNYEAVVSATATAAPILVIAYTNHALDQFLEALVPFTSEIVRVGRRSTNPNIKRFIYQGCKRDGDILEEHYEKLEQTLETSKDLEKELEDAISSLGNRIYDIRKFVTNTYPQWNSWLSQVGYEEFAFWLMGESATEDQRKKRWETAIQNPCKDANCLYTKGLSKTADDIKYLKWRWLHYEEYISLYKTTEITEADPIKLSCQNRWILYFYWMTMYTSHIKMKLEAHKVLLANQWDELQKYRQRQDAQTISKAVVVGMTTTGAAQRQHLLASLRCPIVIVEEAAEVLESHIVVSLTKHCQHLILVGDHQQLRPKTCDHQIGTKYRLGISLFERMVLNKMQCTTLDVQHRMRPEISQLIVPAIYPRLKDHGSVYNLPDVVGIHHNIFFIHHKHEELANGNSRVNMHEVEYVVALASHLINQGHKQSEVSILATYKAQVNAIQEKLDALEDLRVTTVDNFQGEENQIVLLSLVRNNDDGSIGFLAEENRVCVALSRARRGFYIIGNVNLLCSASKLWLKIKEVLVENMQLGPALEIYCSKHPKNVRFAVKPEDFQCLQCKRIMQREE